MRPRFLIMTVLGILGGVLIGTYFGPQIVAYGLRIAYPADFSNRQLATWERSLGMQFHKGIDGNVLVATVATGNTYSLMLRRIADEDPGGDILFAESEELQKGEWTIREYRTDVPTGNTLVNMEMRNAEISAWLTAEFAPGINEGQIDSELESIVNAIKE